MKQTIIPLERTVCETIKAYGMCTQGQRVLVAVSGGIDSVVLLRCLFQIRKELGISLLVGHFNHQLRGKDAVRDEQFVKRLAQKLKLPFIVGSGDVRSHAARFRMSLEEAARTLRYDFFVRIAHERGIAVIALGHTVDDQAETVLIRLVKGTGLRGLSAIRPILHYKKGCFIRPFIRVKRNDITRYARIKGIMHREDKTNKSLKFLRNKVRHRLLPLLEKQFNPQIKEALARLASSADTDMQYVVSAAHALLKQVIRKKEPQRIVLQRKKFLQYHPALCFRIIEEVLRMVSPRSTLDFEHWHYFWNHVSRPRKTQITIDGNVDILIQYNDIVVSRQETHKNYFCAFLDANKVLTIPNAHMRFACREVNKNDIKITNRKSVEYFDVAHITFPLLIRTRAEGDRFKPLGMKGRKKMKDFFIAKKIPQYKRDSIPLILSGRDIMWVVPYSISDDYKITPSTKKALRITVTSLRT